MRHVLRHRRTWLVTALAAVTALALAAVALAHNGHRARYGAAGWVTGKGASTLTIRDGRGAAHTYDVGSGTTYALENRTVASNGDVGIGDVVVVRASAPANGSSNPSATRVAIPFSGVGGLVQSNSGGTLKVVDGNGFTRTVDLSKATCRKARTTIACSSIAANAVVSALGRVSTDRTTLNARTVRVLAPRS